ncbi:mitochondrial peptide methionine sulfoxide reductase-like isoform X6 [Opisthocomus hoazin]|uniref:mitochondrial peptide methionine sulfoxide reductase-like isoform X6 n=1 Tax=Opisthocomus hoazin TaxID=30419 RepID=UPI003F5367CC
MLGAGGLPSPTEALPGRAQRVPVAAGMQTAIFGGNPSPPPQAWGASGERSGSSGRHRESSPPRWATREASPPTPPTKKCAQKLSYEELLKVFWENHDPTQGMQQQEDLGTQYRSVIYTLGPQQQAAALRSREMYQRELRERQRGDITTAIEPAGDFYYAEERHQQYLHKVPGGSCAPKGTGVTCPIAP